MFPRTTKEHAGNGLLDLHVSKDAWRNGCVYFFVNIGVFAHLFEYLLFFLSIGDLSPFFNLLDASHI